MPHCTPSEPMSSSVLSTAVTEVVPSGGALRGQPGVNEETWARNLESAGDCAREFRVAQAAPPADPAAAAACRVARLAAAPAASTGPVARIGRRPRDSPSLESAPDRPGCRTACAPQGERQTITSVASGRRMPDTEKRATEELCAAR